MLPFSNSARIIVKNNTGMATYWVSYTLSGSELVEEKYVVENGYVYKVSTFRKSDGGEYVVRSPVFYSKFIKVLLSENAEKGFVDRLIVFWHDPPKAIYIKLDFEEWHENRFVQIKFGELTDVEKNIHKILLKLPDGLKSLNDLDFLDVGFIGQNVLMVPWTLMARRVLLVLRKLSLLPAPIILEVDVEPSDGSIATIPAYLQIF